MPNSSQSDNDNAVDRKLMTWAVVAGLAFVVLGYLFTSTFNVG